MPNIMKSLIELGGDIANTQVANTLVANSNVAKSILELSPIATHSPTPQQKEPTHSGAKVHIFFEKPVIAETDKVYAKHAEVRTKLWVYTDKKEIKDDIAVHIANIREQLTTQYNNGFTAKYKYKGKEAKGEIPFLEVTIPLTFIFEVEYLDLFHLVEKPAEAERKLRDKAQEPDAYEKNYCFIHLNDGNASKNGLVGFSDGCMGSWSVGAANNNSHDSTALPLHFAHEMAHLLGYLNVVRSEKIHYFSNDIIMCQHPPISQLPTNEQLTIMATNRDRRVIQQDIDNLNFGMGLLVDAEFWIKNSNINTKIFKKEFKYGIHEENATPKNDMERVKKVGQVRPNIGLVFLTHPNLGAMYDKIIKKER